MHWKRNDASVYARRHLFLFGEKESSNIRVPSNVYWHNSATIKQFPTDLQKYSLVLVKQASNVTIDGGEFVGDVQTHTGMKGEWGHGIMIAGGRNVVLKNLTTREFWGDGIDLLEAEYDGSLRAGVGPCHNIMIDQVKCLYNRRQGLSIEAAICVRVYNSEFAYTGKFKFTEPGCGIDIEPWCKNEKKIEDIKLYNCYVHDNNSKRDLCLEPNLQYYDRNKHAGYAPENKIIVKDCRIGRLYILWANNVIIDNCDIKDISHYNFGEKVVIRDCVIREKSGVKIKRGLSFRRCK